MAETRWTSTDVLAWSRSDGPGPSPGAPGRWITASVAAVLAVTVSGILVTDALCPEHRAWVQGLAGVAVVSSVVAIAQVLRGQSSASLFALFGALCGVGIGAVDFVHAPGRGALIVAGFAVVAAASAVVAFRMTVLARWDDQLAVAHRADGRGTAVAPTTATAPSTSTAATDGSTVGARRRAEADAAGR